MKTSPLSIDQEIYTVIGGAFVNDACGPSYEDGGVGSLQPLAQATRVLVKYMNDFVLFARRTMKRYRVPSVRRLTAYQLDGYIRERIREGGGETELAALREAGRAFLFIAAKERPLEKACAGRTLADLVGDFRRATSARPAGPYAIDEQDWRLIEGFLEHVWTHSMVRHAHEIHRGHLKEYLEDRCEKFGKCPEPIILALTKFAYFTGKAKAFEKVRRLVERRLEARYFEGMFRALESAGETAQIAKHEPPAATGPVTTVA